MNVRLERVRELIRRELAQVIERNYSFPNKLVTVHDAIPAADLKSCRVFVGVLGGHLHEREQVIEKLKAARGAIQRELYKRVKLKNSPQLWIQLDNSAERGVHTVNVIDNLPPIVEDYGIDESLYIQPKSAMKKQASNQDEDDIEDIDEEEEEEDETLEEEQDASEEEEDDDDWDDEEDDDWDEDEEEEDEDEEGEDDIDEDGDRAYKQ
jgi:ribosome-binding factor A